MSDGEQELIPPDASFGLTRYSVKATFASLAAAKRAALQGRPWATGESALDFS
jgi:hypothetical protein